MKTNNIKQIIIVLICATGLNFSGNYLLEMSYIDTLLDGLNVMIFFTCFFPFLIVTFALISKFFRSISKVAYH
tara:strand:- start:30 stop:248 length:219 start_codon:yes stop_codon:yes gene_type:complete